MVALFLFEKVSIVAFVCLTKGGYFVEVTILQVVKMRDEVG